MSQKAESRGSMSSAAILEHYSSLRKTSTFRDQASHTSPVLRLLHQAMVGDSSTGERVHDTEESMNNRDRTAATGAQRLDAEEETPSSELAEDSNSPSATPTHFRRSEQSSRPGTNDAKGIAAQRLSMLLYEGRIASMERFIAFCVMLHETGSNVQSFWSHVSGGLLAYRIDRTQSVMRVATTASPVSGSEVRERMEHLARITRIKAAVTMLGEAVSKYKSYHRWRWGDGSFHGN
eukprot:scaffold2390_cov280-Prasinococcus_capsulatus_cf.AAC.10